MLVGLFPRHLFDDAGRTFPPTPFDDAGRTFHPLIRLLMMIDDPQDLEMEAGFACCCGFGGCAFAFDASPPGRRPPVQPAPQIRLSVVHMPWYCWFLERLLFSDFQCVNIKQCVMVNNCASCPLLGDLLWCVLRAGALSVMRVCMHFIAVPGQGAGGGLSFPGTVSHGIRPPAHGLRAWHQASRRVEGMADRKSVV